MCNLEQGKDAISDEWIKITQTMLNDNGEKMPTNENECAALVMRMRTKIESGKIANGVTTNSNGDCWAQFGAEGTKHSRDWMTCIFPGKISDLSVLDITLCSDIFSHHISKKAANSNSYILQV